MTLVTANEYLDRRRPGWLDAETLGIVQYEPGLKLVMIGDHARDIQGALYGQRVEVGGNR